MFMCTQYKYIYMHTYTSRIHQCCIICDNLYVYRYIGIYTYVHVYTQYIYIYACIHTRHEYAIIASVQAYIRKLSSSQMIYIHICMYVCE